MLRDVKWRSVFTALFYFYIVPLVPPVILSSLHDRFASPDNVWGHFSVGLAAAIGSFIWSVCFCIVSPIVAAYFAAKWAGTHPLSHGVIAGIVGVVMFLLWAPNAAPAFKMTVALIISFCSLFGSWLWRCQSRSVIERE